MIYLVLFLLTVQCITSVPVVSGTGDNEEEEIDNYKHYLEEAPKSLHLDPETLASLKTLLAGNITAADYIRLWNSSLRDWSDESKRHIVEKLVEARSRQKSHESDSDSENLGSKRKPSNMELVQKAVNRLRELDSLQEKQYEEHVAKEKAERVKQFLELPEEKRAEMIKHFKEEAEKHRKRPKVHQPGSDEQLKEYWEKQEGMERETFNPRTLFSEIDLDGDGHLSVHEVEAVLQRELDKVYDMKDPEFDPLEEKYDRNKMRQKFMEHYDTNGDYFVSLDEFLKGIESSYAKRDEDWKTAQDEEDMFETNEEELRRLASEAQKQAHVTEQSHPSSSKV
ncbi:unnamed protein product [Trichobilharzia szidati]|nr:unnamed protein product [Trichobilharzia szidati]